MKSLGVEEFRKQVEEDWEYGANSPNKIDQSEINRIKKFFTEPDYKALSAIDFKNNYKSELHFLKWIDRNTRPHKIQGYRSVTISLKGKKQQAPGDILSQQMRDVARSCRQVFIQRN